MIPPLFGEGPNVYSCNMRIGRAFRIRIIGLSLGLVGLRVLAGCAQGGNFTPGDEEVLFRDDFTGRLETGWLLDGAGPDVSVTERDGSLSLFPPDGIPSGEPTAKTALLRELSGDFVLVTSLDFQTSTDLQSSGLVVQGDDGRTVLLGITKIDQVGFRGILMLADRGPDVERGRALVRSDLQTVYLRLERVGDRYIGSYSSDGMIYAALSPLTNDLSASVSVGVGTLVAGACTSNCEAGIPAHFDFFEIRSSAQ